MHRDVRIDAIDTSRGHLDSGVPRPHARGPLSAALLEGIADSPGSLGSLPVVRSRDALTDDDLQLALYVCYELHYRGFADVDPEWEWDPTLLGFRARLEIIFLDHLRATMAPLPADMGPVGDRLVDLVAAAGGPSLSGFMLASGTPDTMREFCVHRSAYQLKEADPHTFVIPRLFGDAKSTIVEIQADEYGSGRPGQMHAELFAVTMRELGLDPRYGAYVDRLPAETLATVNLVSLFGLHRRWRGALVGHLAAFEMTSVEPMSRYSRALARMGFGAPARRFYDVHVDADVHHGAIALERMVGGLVADEPHLGADVLFGAAAVMAVERRFAEHLVDAWSAGRSSLLPLSSEEAGSASDFARCA